MRAFEGEEKKKSHMRVTTDKSTGAFSRHGVIEIKQGQTKLIPVVPENFHFSGMWLVSTLGSLVAYANPLDTV